MRGPNGKGGGTWRCDVCGEDVDADPDGNEGYVVWAGAREPGAGEIRIIHKVRCDISTRLTHSLPLTDFLGPDGLAKLLSMIAWGPVHEDEDDVPERPLQRRLPLNTWADFVRRVQIPGYEEVRPDYLNGTYRRHAPDASESYPYLQSSIASFIRDREQGRLSD